MFSETTNSSCLDPRLPLQAAPADVMDIQTQLINKAAWLSVMRQAQIPYAPGLKKDEAEYISRVDKRRGASS